MNADFSKNTFAANKNYRRVLMQQGRVQVDADFNEYTAIEKTLQEAVTRAIVGPYGAHVTGANPEESGFALIEDGGTLKIASGTFFVDGILLETETAVPLDGQPFPNGLDLPIAPNAYFLYLEVWERKLSALDNGHEQIKEVALGGADTTVRTQYVWQVKWTQLPQGVKETECIENLDTWNDLLDSQVNQSTLTARSHLPPENQKPCIVKASGGYSGLQNQLYRVEVHTPGNIDQASFKWSRDNASVQARWLSSPNPDELEIDETGKDTYLSFATDQWIELIDQKRLLAGEPGSLVKITKVEGRIITVDLTTKTGTIDFNDFENPTLRRWDSNGHSKITQPAQNDGYLGLEEGVEVRFDLPAGNKFKIGDYWLIPARSEIADVEWPADAAENPLPQTPHGIERHYAPLGLLFLQPNKPALFADRRPLFSPLTQQTELNYVSGDGQEGLPALKDGRPLGTVPEALIVGVSNGDQPVAGAPVRFKVIQGQSELSHSTQKGTELIVFTDSNGLANVNWLLDAKESAPFHRVEAQLLSNCQQDRHVPVIFNARLNIAAHVIYSDPSCANLSQEATVDGALKTLSRLSGLYYLGGDGQEFQSGQWLPQPLQVTVRNQCGPVSKAKISCLAPEGSLLAKDPAGFANANNNKLTLTTDAKGIATCYWNPKSIAGLKSLQMAVSLSAAEGNPIAQPAILHFSTRESLQGGATYPPTVGQGGTFPTLVDAFNQLEGSESINLSLLPGTHELGDHTVKSPKTIKLTGAGMANTLIRLTGRLECQSKECILRDLSVINGDPKKQSTVVLEVAKADIHNTVWARKVGQKSTAAWLQLGDANGKNPSRIDISASKFIAISQITKGAFSASKRFLLNSKTPTTLKPLLTDFYKLNPETQMDKIGESARAIALAARSQSSAKRKAWAKAGSEIIRPRVTARARTSTPLPTFGMIEARTVALRRADHVTITGRPTEVVFQPEAIRAATAVAVASDDANLASSTAFFDSIKVTNPSISKVTGALLGLAQGRIETNPEMAIAVPNNQTEVTLLNNDIAGILGLSTQFPKELSEDFTKALLRRRFQIGADLHFSNNEFLKVITFASHTNPNSQTAIAGFRNVDLENNRFSEGNNSFFGERVSLHGNRFEAEQERTGHCLAKNAFIIGNQSINSDNVSFAVLAQDVAETSNLPSFFMTRLS